MIHNLNPTQMEQNKKLYPITFNRETERHSWGTEKFAIADLGIVDPTVKEGWLAGNTFSDIMETYIERISGEEIYGYYGRQFPVAVSFLEVDGQMPVMCHPDDEAAEQRYDALGRRTLWYITEASEDARIYLGFNGEMTASGLYEKCLDGTVRDSLNVIIPQKGDSLHISPGTPYSAEGHMRIVAISEASAITFTLHDPAGSPEDSHVTDAIDLIEYGKTGIDSCLNRSNLNCNGLDCSASDRNGNPAGNAGTSVPVNSNGAAGRQLLSSREFSVNEMKVTDPIKVTAGNSFTIYVCLEGGLSIQVPSKNESGESCMENCRIKKGDAVLMPADIEEFFIVPTDRDTVLIEAVIESRDEIDDYINPDTEPYLEGEDYEGLENEADEDSDTDSLSKDAATEPGNAKTAGSIRRFLKN